MTITAGGVAGRVPMVRSEHIDAPKGGLWASILIHFLPDIAILVNSWYWNWRYDVREKAALYHYSKPGEAHAAMAKLLDPEGHILKNAERKKLQARLLKKLDSPHLKLGEENSQYDS